jgi:hypothetical protein
LGDFFVKASGHPVRERERRRRRRRRRRREKVKKSFFF